MLYDFIQVLNSLIDVYIKNYYFSKHILFTTNSLLQKQRLNPRNYSKQELIMRIFVWAINHDMNMHAKNIEYEHAHIFIEKYFKVLLHVILYNTILRKIW